VAGLAAALRSKPAAGSSVAPLRLGALVEIRRGAGEPALFVIPGGHGGMIEMTLYAKLMAHVEGELAVWGLLAQLPEGKGAARRPVAQMAEAFLGEIRRVRPRGPYALAGECVGGVVALEMAQRLRAQGEDVSLLLLDSWCPTDAGERHYWWVERPCDVARQRFAVARAALRDLAAAFRGQARAGPLRWLARIAVVGSAGPLARNYVEQAMRYRPSPYDGAVRLVVTARNHSLGLARDWQRVARGGLEVRVVPGNHETYIRDTAAQTARALAGWLPLGDGSAR
jgi:acetoacetyl-CoA synthetase